MNKFWNMSVEQNIGHVDLFGEISDVSWWGDEVTPTMFKDDLTNLGDINDLEIHINSGGGDVFAGFAIYNMLARHKAHKTVYIEGLAASIASLIAMAGDEIIMPENSMMMIHNAWAGIAGNADELRKMADELDKVDGILRTTYVNKTGLEEDEIRDMMANETWFTAYDALEKGFATAVEAPVAMAASVDKKIFDRYHHVPENLFGEKEEVEVEDLNNRGESEPVEVIDTPAEEQEIAEAPDRLEEQRKDFNRIRKKIYERN